MMSLFRAGMASMSRIVFLFIPGMATIAIREAGWDRVFTDEVVCQFLSLGHREYSPPSKALVEKIDYVAYAIQAVSVSFMLIAYAPRFWRSTDLSKAAEHYRFNHSKKMQPERLSAYKNVVIYGLCTAGVCYYVIGILRTFQGQEFQLTEEFFISEVWALPIAIAMSAFWAMVSFGVKMPGYFKRSFQFFKPKQDREAGVVRWCSKRFLIKFFVGLSSAIAMSDYMARFLEEYSTENIYYYSIVIFLAAILSFIYSVFTTGSALDNLSKLKVCLRKRPYTTSLLIILGGVDGLIWLVFNTNQIANRLGSWIDPPLHPITAKNTSFAEVCREQISKRGSHPKIQLAIIILSFVFLVVPLTVCTVLYMLVLATGVDANAQSAGELGVGDSNVDDGQPLLPVARVTGNKRIVGCRSCCFFLTEHSDAEEHVTVNGGALHR